jgi:hypothetical protein
VFLATDPEARVRFPAIIEKKVVCLERGPLSLVNTTEQLLDRIVAAPVEKTENTAVGIRFADHVAPSIRKKLAITSPTSGGRSVGIVRSRTQTMEFFVFFCFCSLCCFVAAGVGLFVVAKNSSCLLGDSNRAPSDLYSVCCPWYKTHVR